MRSLTIRSQKGFGLIEVMVGVSVLAISGLAMMSLLEQNFRSTATIEAKLGKVALAQDIRTQLSRAATCKVSLADVNQYNFDAKGHVPISFRFSNELTVPGDKTKDHYSLNVSKMYFVPSNLPALPPLPDGSTEVMGELMFESGGKQVGTLQHQPVSAGRVILRHNGPTITECGSENALAAAKEDGECEPPTGVPNWHFSCDVGTVNHEAHGLSVFDKEKKDYVPVSQARFPAGSHFKCGPNLHTFCVSSKWVNIDVGDHVAPNGADGSDNSGGPGGR